MSGARNLVHVSLAQTSELGGVTTEREFPTIYFNVLHRPLSSEGLRLLPSISTESPEYLHRPLSSEGLRHMAMAAKFFNIPCTDL